MYSDFQLYILEDIEETGDYNFILSIPNYLKFTKNKHINFNGGIGKHTENYNISDNDFCKLRNQITQIFKDFNLGLYRYIPGIESEKWKDSYDLLSASETEKFLSEKENWIYPFNDSDKPAFFISEKEGSNKIEEYFNKENETNS
ncbi:MAG: hypothetical protein GY830_10640 [Bacteroidetes bacterium]|nr:hypothetical protein [Bacteroidota bacterium]